ncbi:MAG: BrnA antitoxin family protein [Treponema sp.]|nr:BrnA antitoxin family protein [Treponema sp.]
MAWFKGYGKGYQSRINAALRNVMQQSVQGQE